MTVPFKVDLSKEIAVITGGGGILGCGMAKALAECGAKVAVMDLRLEAAEKVAAEIRKEGGKAIALACNVLEKDSLDKANDAVEKEFGTISLLINGAGGNHPKGTTTMDFLNATDMDKHIEGVRTFYELDLKDLSFVFNLNFLGTLLPAQSFTKGMVKKGRGTVINISSMNAFTPLTRIPAYSGAKAAVSNFTQWLAVHFSKVGIRVNAIAPGFFLTEQNRSLLNNPDGTLTARGKSIIAHTPMGGFGDPSDLSGALLYLSCEKASRFVTGAVILVDGGFNAYSGV